MRRTAGAAAAAASEEPAGAAAARFSHEDDPIELSDEEEWQRPAPAGPPAPPAAGGPSARHVIDLLSDEEEVEEGGGAGAGAPGPVGARRAPLPRSAAVDPPAPEGAPASRSPAEAVNRAGARARESARATREGPGGARSPPAAGTPAPAAPRPPTLVGMWERSARRQEEAAGRGEKKEPVVLKRSCPCRKGDCAVLKVRKSGKNFGREFFRCPHYRDPNLDCGYFAWKGPDFPTARAGKEKPVSRFGEGRSAGRRRGAKRQRTHAPAQGPYATGEREAAVDLGWQAGAPGGGWEGMGAMGDGVDVDAL